MALFQSRDGQALDHTPLCSQAHLGAEATEEPPKQNFPGGVARPEPTGRTHTRAWNRRGAAGTTVHS
jgi:hypothetical protein